jgi:hypothetical protein
MKTCISILCLLIGVTLAQAQDKSVAVKKPPEVEKSNERVDSILAAVNGTPISLMDVLNDSRREESRLCLVYSGPELYQEVHNLRKKILEEIISRHLILADYGKKKFPIPPEYVENMLDDLALNYGCVSRNELEEKAKKSGTTIEELRKKAVDKIAIQVMINNYYYANVNLTPKELFDYYEKNKSEFSSPAKLKLQLLLLRSDHDNFADTLKQVTAELKDANRKVFIAMVGLYSDGPAAKNDGDLGWIEEGRLRPEFAVGLKNLKAGNITAPIQTQEGIYFLRIDAYEPAVTSSYRELNNELRDKIEKKLKEKAYEEYITKLKADAIIRYYY